MLSTHDTTQKSNEILDEGPETIDAEPTVFHVEQLSWEDSDKYSSRN